MDLLRKFFITLVMTALTIGSIYLTVILGWLVFCWQCGRNPGGPIWLVLLLSALISSFIAFLISRLPKNFGGEEFKLSICVIIVTLVGFWVTQV